MRLLANGMRASDARARTRQEHFDSYSPSSPTHSKPCTACDVHGEMALVATLRRLSAPCFDPSACDQVRPRARARTIQFVAVRAWRSNVSATAFAGG